MLRHFVRGYWISFYVHSSYIYMINIANDGYKRDPSIESSRSNLKKTVALVYDQTLAIP